MLRRGIDEGDAVAAPGTALSGAPFALADLSELEVELAISERDLGRIVAGQRCEVRASAFFRRRLSSEGHPRTADGRSRDGINTGSSVRIVVPQGDEPLEAGDVGEGERVCGRKVRSA